MRKYFFRPFAQKTLDLLKHSNQYYVTPETLRTLQDISKSLDPCQRIQSTPMCFRSSIGAENCSFNERIFLYIIYIGSDPVLKFVEKGTRLSAARFALMFRQNQFGRLSPNVGDLPPQAFK